MATKRKTLSPSGKAAARSTGKTARALKSERGFGKTASKAPMRRSDAWTRLEKVQRELNAIRSTMTQVHMNGKAVSVLERWRAAGLIGCVDDAPADLSTNPKHMEGFGGF